jgi:hypothetical protein
VGSALPLAALTSGATYAPQGGTVLNTVLAGLEGAGWGGIDALGHGEDVTGGQLSGAAFGAGGNLAAKGLGSVFDTISGMLSPGVGRMTPQEVRLAKNRQYQDVENMGVRYTPQAVDELVHRVDDAMLESSPTNQRLARGAQRRFRQTVPGYRTPIEIDQQRAAIRRDAANTRNPSEDEFGRRMVGAIDDWTGSRGRNDVTSWSGDPDDVLGMLDEARQLANRTEKLDDLDERVGRGKRQAERNLYSGEDSTLKQSIAQIRDNPQRRSRYTADEIAKMDEINAGTTTQKVARNVGRMAPGGGMAWPAATAAGALGFTLGGPAGGFIGGALPSVIGYGAKKLSERSTAKSVEEFLDMVSTGRSIKNPKTMTPDQERGLADLLMMMGISAND